MIHSMMRRNLFKQFLENPNGVCKFAICSMFVQFWSHQTCYSTLLNIYHFSLCFHGIINVMSHPTCKLHGVFIKCNGIWKDCGCNLKHYHITIGHRCYNCHILPFVDVKVEESIEHVSGNEEEKMEAIGVLTEFLRMVLHRLH